MTPDLRQLAALVAAQERVALAGPDVCAVMATLADCARGLTAAAGAVVELADERHVVTRVVMDPAVGGAGVRLLDVGATARALAERRSVRGHEPAEALLAAPLWDEQRVIGVLTVVAPRPHAFDAADVHLLHLLARFGGHQLAVADRLHSAERAGRTDPLTELGNRRAFDEAVTRELAVHARYDRALTLCLVDLDGFKAVNDRHGHQVGDKLLIDVARRLNEVRGADLAFRLGGDEFALLLPETDRDAAELVARRLARQIAEDGRHQGLGASWGAAEATDLDAESFLARADAEMYVRKRAGRPAGIEAAG